MNTQKKIDVEESLSSYPAEPAPEDLGRRIREEIPALEPLPARKRRMPFVPVWARVAAALCLVGTATWIGYRVSRPEAKTPLPRAVASPRRTLPPAPSVADGAPVQPPVAIAAQPAASRPTAAPGSTMLEGLVTDDAGSALPGVTVKVTGPGVPRTAVSDAKGRIALQLPAGGKYKVETELPGFNKRVQEFQIASGETTKFQAPLKLAATAEVIVSAEAPLVDMRATMSGSMSSENRYLYDGVSSGTGVAPATPALVPMVAPKAPPSTGGTHEPNDQPYGDVFFRTSGVNPFIDTEDDPLSTFGLDVDTGSYGVARRYLADGNLPPAEAIRVEEFVNAFDYGDPAPSRGDFAMLADGGPTPFRHAGDRYRLVRFHLRARDVAAADRKPATLTFVVDVSGSMAQENRLGLVKRALGLLLDRLRPIDRVGLVVFGSTARTILEPTGDLEAIRRSVDLLVSEGSTNAEDGLRTGYAMAARHRREDAINRVILCSDGVANVGRTGPDSILAVIEQEAKAGIELTTVGFGMGNYNDVLMEQLADKGNGRYAYVDTLKEAKRIFVENLTGTLQTIASDARVQVEFDPDVVARYRLLGYENRDIADERFRDDKVDAGEIGAGHQVTAVYEIKLAPGVSSGTAATLRLRYRSAETKEFVEVERDLRVGDFSRSWARAPRGLRLAGLVAELAEVLRKSHWAKDADVAELARRIRALERDYPADERVSELADLAEEAAHLLAAIGKRANPEQ